MIRIALFVGEISVCCVIILLLMRRGLVMGEFRKLILVWLGKTPRSARFVSLDIRWTPMGGVSRLDLKIVLEKILMETVLFVILGKLLLMGNVILIKNVLWRTVICVLFLEVSRNVICVLRD